MEAKSSLCELAKTNFVDYFRIAPIERMCNAPVGSRPSDILPGAKSIISMAVRLRSGVRYTNKAAYEGKKMAIAVYMNFGMQFMNNILDQAAFAIYRELTDEGYLTVPLPAAHPYPYINEVIFDKTKQVNLFSHRHAAVAAGIGEFGWNSLLITPDAGPRVRCVTVITEAEIEPDEMYKGEPICEKDRCPDPLKCAKVCPMEAIDLRQGKELEIVGKLFSYGKVDFTRCMWGSLGLRKATLGKFDCYMPGRRNVSALYKALMEEDLLERQERFGNANMCGRCIIHCPIGDNAS